MNDCGVTGLARTLAAARPVEAASALSAAWADQTLGLRLRGAGRAPPDIASHLRRSFLGALGRGASPEAQAGRPCPWDPPCALDVFRREQLRGPRGDGLPKPYVIAAWPEGRDLIVRLRVFGMANDWAMAAFEAMVAGVGTILPWPRVARGMRPPEATDRAIAFSQIPPSPAPEAVRLTFLSPMDASGADAVAEPHTILARALRRADALGRWHGVALDPAAGAALAQELRSLTYDLSELRFGRHCSPNRHGQQRRDPTIAGSVIIRGNLMGIWPALRIAERAHIGRHAVEGLGRVRVTSIL